MGPGLVTSVAMIVVGVGAAWLWRHREPTHRLRWIWWGGGAWAATVAAKVGLALLLNKPLLAFLRGALPRAIYLLIGSVWIGLLTGLTEVLLGYLIAARLRYRSYAQGFGYGLGFGVVEAIIVGFGVLASLLVATLSPDSMAAPTRDAILSGTWSTAAVGPIERVLTLVIHSVSGMLIVRSLAGGGRRDLLAAFLYKTLVDGVAGAEHLTGVTKSWNPWFLELPFVLFAGVGVLLHRRAAARWPQDDGEPY